MKDTAFDGKDNGEFCDLTQSFTDLDKSNRRGILKTAKNLLKIQKEDKAVVADGPSPETERLA